jgi:hypothetical protein
MSAVKKKNEVDEEELLARFANEAEDSRGRLGMSGDNRNARDRPQGRRGDAHRRTAWGVQRGRRRPQAIALWAGHP